MNNGVIYAIKNKVNNKMYIGKTIDIIYRINRHFDNLKDNDHYNNYLQNSYNKYGKENFKVIILEENIKKENLSDREIFWIEFFNTFKGEGYNLSSGGIGGVWDKEIKKKISNTMKGRTFSEETRKKMSRAQKGKKHPHSKKTKEKISKNHPRLSGKNHPMYGKEHSKETKKKMSKSSKGKKNGMYGKNISIEQKKRISKAQRKLNKKQCFNIYKKYKNNHSLTLKKLTNEYNVCIATISNIVNLKHWSADYIKKNIKENKNDRTG